MKKRCVPEKSLAQLRELSQFVDEIANFRHNPRQPWVGQTAFAHKGGMHVNAVQKVARSFEHIDPALVGNRRRVLVSDLAGRSNIVMKAQELGFRVTNDTPELKTILARIKELEHEGYEFEAAEASLALLISRALQARGAAVRRGCLPRLDAPRRAEFDLRSHRQGARRRRGRPHRGRRRRPGERARQGAARGAGQVLSAAQEGGADRLQGAHPRILHRHRRARPACSSSPPTARENGARSA